MLQNNLREKDGEIMARYLRDSEIDDVKEKRGRNKKYAANQVEDARKQCKKQSDYRRNQNYQTLYEYFNPD